MEHENQTEYPLHWGGYNNQEPAAESDALIDINKNDTLKKLFNSEVQPAEAKSSPLSDRGKELIARLTSLAPENQIRNYTSWEQAAGDLALRVARLEQQLKYSQKITMTKE